MTEVTIKPTEIIARTEGGVDNVLSTFDLTIQDGGVIYGSSLAYGLAQALKEQLDPINDDAWKAQIRQWLFPEVDAAVPPPTGIDEAWNDPADTFRRNVHGITADLAKMLIEKNKAYGNSALEPVRVFSKANAEEQLLVRLDDKLSRLQRGHEYQGDDTIKDLLGYLVLLLIARDPA